MADEMSKPSDARPRSNAGMPRRRSRRKMEPAAFPTLEPFGKRLESLRLQRGFTQRALAARAKISTNHYQEIAHAQANPTMTVLLSLADALSVSIVDLFWSITSPPDVQRTVFVADLKELTAAHSRLTDIIERLATDELMPRPRTRPTSLDDPE